MLRCLRGLALGLFAGAALLTQARAAAAQAPAPTEVEELRQRLEKLEKQNQDLLKILETHPALTRPGAVEASPDAAARADAEAVSQIVEKYLSKKEEEAKVAAKKSEAETTGFVVGKDLSMKSYWNHGLWAETADKAFKIHVGGRVQMDTIFYSAENSLMFGPGGTGPIDDAFAWRRARLEMDGTIFEVIDFFAEWDFANTFNADPLTPAVKSNVFNTPVPTDLWAQITNLPIFNVLRVGNQKPPISLEHLTSSRFLPFLERSYAFDAFIGGLDNGFKPGFQLINWSSNERMTWAVGVFKNVQTVNGWNVGDGEYDVTGRITGLPVYEDNGRCLVHLGLGASHRDVDDSRYRLRARTLLRNGPAALHTPLTNVLLGASTEDLIVPEFALQWGQFSMQAEYFANWFHGTTFPAGGAGQGTTYFQSAYLQMLYFLTPGDRFTYNMKGGSGAAFARVVPQRPFYFVKGENQNNLFSSGAWQVGARYSWADFNDKAVQGGILHDITLGVNWFLNPNIKFQWNYCAGYRDTSTGLGEGWAHGFGMRMAYDF